MEKSNEFLNEYFGNKLIEKKGKILIRVLNTPKKGLYSKVIGYKLLDTALNLTNIHHPKIMGKTFLSKNLDLEVLETKTKIESLEKTYFIENFEYYLLEGIRIVLSKREEKVEICDKIKRKQPWKNNTSFFKYQLKSLKEFIKKNKKMLYNDEEILENVSEFDKVLLDNSRTMALIHGNVAIDNMVQEKNYITYINWDMGCIGDIAYEIAKFSLNMHYKASERLNIIMEEKRIIDKICEVNLQIDKDKLKRDIDIYKKFEDCRMKLINLILD